MRKDFPWDIVEKVAERGYTGVGIPKEYGELGLGATGACIVAEVLNRMQGGVGSLLATCWRGKTKPALLNVLIYRSVKQLPPLFDLALSCR